MRKYYGRGMIREVGAPPLRTRADTHCQICKRDIYANNKRGLIAHHGYKRPGYGEQTSSCYGARWQPYEESRSAIPPYIDIVNNEITAVMAHIALMKIPGYMWKETFLKKNPKHVLDFEILDFRPHPESEEEHKKYLGALERRLRGEEWRLTSLHSELARLQTRHDTWKPKEQPHA